MIAGILAAATFEPPSTKDFVYGCWGPSIKIGGFDFCFNFITFLVTLTTLIVLALFFFAFRKPKTVPGKLQMIMELGVQFVRENIAVPMLGPDAETFMPLLASFFFFILIGNLFEVIPGFSFSANSRVAIPLVLAGISWVTYNAVGIRKHGFIGYLRHTCIIPAAPGWLRYTLLLLIEFVSNIIVRPITLTVRLAANFLAGHFLLAIFFLGTSSSSRTVPRRGSSRVCRSRSRSCWWASRSSSRACRHSSSPSSAPPTSGRPRLRNTS